MPAIQPARLRIQVTRLAELFNQPRAFVRALHGFLELYSDRTHRAGQSGNPPPLLASYNVPRPVLRHILRELHLPVFQDTQQTLELCRALWAEPYYEFRYIAVHLAGLAHLDPEVSVLHQIEIWLDSQPGEHILSVLLDQGVARLRQEQPELLLELAKEWLANPKITSQQNALRLLRPLALDTDADHLPAIYPLIAPLIRRAPSVLRPDLIHLVSAAAITSPQETAYMLRQNLDTPDSTDAAWLIRQVIDEFPPNQQDSLKSAMADVKLKLP